MKKNLKVVLIILVIALICVVGYAGKKYLSDNKNTDQTSNIKADNNIANTTKVPVEQTDKKEDTENKKDVTEEAKENEKEQVQSKPEEPVKEEVSLSDEDKAIEMAKKEYGTTNGVYFRIEQIQSNGVYIVSVRDNETTRDLAWYTVNVINGTIK